VRRLHLIFAIVVVTAFVSAFLAERTRPAEPEDELPPPPAVAPLEPLSPRRGDHALAGFVVDAQGRPAAEVSVKARPLDADLDEPFAFAQTDARGAFTLEHLAAGRHAIVLVRPGVPTTEAEVAVPADTPPELRLAEPYPELPDAPDPVYVAFSGSVRRPAELGGDASLEGYEVVLLPLDDEARWRGAMERRATVDADGRFSIDDLAVADHRIAVVPPWARGGTWPYLVERALAADAIAAGANDETAAEDALALELEVGEIDGRLFDARGRAIEGALLRVRPVGASDERSWPAASTDAEGRFALRDLPATDAGVLYEISVHAGAARLQTQVEALRGARREARFGALNTRPDEAGD